MGKNFKEFWKRQIAKVLAVTMTLSTLCSAGVPIVHAEEEPLVEVDGRIISETAMQKISEGGSWTDSFEFTAEVLNEIFGTTIATLDADTDITLDLAKNINEFTPEEEEMLVAIKDIITIDRSAALTISGNGKYMAYKAMACYLPNLPDTPIQNFSPVQVGEKWYSNLVAGYLGVEGTLVNRENALSIGLGNHASAEALQARYQNTYNVTVETNIPATANYLGKSFNLLAADSYTISNLPYVGSANYQDMDTEPTVILVAKSPRAVKRVATVRDVTNTAAPTVVDTLISYQTESGKSYVANTDTTEKVTATATLPAGYSWAPGEDGVAEFGYWDTTAYIDIVLVQHNTNFSVVDKYDSDVSLPNAILSLEQKYGENWQWVGDLNAWQLTPDLINAIRAAATTFNYEFRIKNRVAHPGYAVDTDYVILDSRYDNNLSKQFQETAKHVVHIANIADNGTPMAGATYTLTYGEHSEVLTLNASGTAQSAVFLDSGLETVTITRTGSVDGYTPDASKQNRTINLNDMVYSANDNAFAYTITDQDTWIVPDYNHSVNIHVVDETNTAVENVQLGIYTDANCTTPATAEDGTNIAASALTTNALGNIALPEIPAGTYYIKLTRSTAGYSDVLFAPATAMDTDIFTITVVDDDNSVDLEIGIRRQYGDITLTVKDENGTPVAGVEYELKAIQIAPDYAGVNIPANTVVAHGYTDDNGVLHITQMNRGALHAKNILNGTYELSAISVPLGYRMPTNNITVDLDWEEHANIVYAAVTTSINNVTYTTNFTVVDKYDSAVSLNNAVLSVQQKFGENWQWVGDLDAWQLTPALISTIRAAANTFNYEFQIINRVAHPGYAVDTKTIIIDSRYDNNLTNQFQETRRNIIHISNIADDGTPMAGAKYVLTYGDYSEELVLDSEGKISSQIFLENGADSFTLTRVGEIENYLPEVATRTIRLSDMTYDTNSNAYAVAITDSDTYSPPDYNHHININVVNEANFPVKNVQLGVYTDAACTTPAKAENGADISADDLTTDDNGNIVVPEVTAGTYYIKLIRSTVGYSDELFDLNTNTDTEIYTVVVDDDDTATSLNIGIRFQVGTITLIARDENGAPIQGALYTARLESVSENFVDALLGGFPIGNYTTDSEGRIVISAMDMTTPIPGNKLINATYTLTCQQVPPGYTDANTAPIVFDLNWEEHAAIINRTEFDDFNSVQYQTNFSVVDKNNTSTQLPDAVLTLQQKVSGNWQDVGVLDRWELTTDLIAIIKAAAQTNNYEFRIINSDAQPGYVVDTAEVLLDARIDNNLSMRFEEASQHVVYIKNVAADGTPMAGVKYTLTYGDFTDEIILNEQGEGSSEIFLASDDASLVLTRDTSYGDYTPVDSTLNRTLNLSDMTLGNGTNVFAYTFVDADIVPDYNHNINIHIVNELGHNVGNVQMGIFTDAECTTPAKAEDGSDIAVATLTSNASGMINLPEVPVGTYYIKLVNSTEGYSDTLFDPATTDIQGVFVANVADDFNDVTVEVGIHHQVGDIKLTVLDENDAPVVGATYALKLNGTVIGEYTTDDNGVIHIDALDDGSKILNGQYTLVFVSAPAGYKVSERGTIAYNLNWVEHYDIVYAEEHDIIEKYLTYTLNIDIKDAQMEHEFLYTRYADEADTTFKDAYQNSLLSSVAYLTKGKDITLTITNLAPIKVVIDGQNVVIPANTTLLTHEVNGALSFSFTNFYYQPTGADAPIAIDIPQGSYRFALSASGTGYEWVAQDLNEDIYNDENRTIDVTLREQILYTTLKLTKMDAHYNTPINGIKFALVNVDVLKLHGLNTNDTTLTNKDVANFLTENEITPPYTATSNAQGKIDFGAIPYGTYWLIELDTAASQQYETSYPIVVNAIGGTIDEVVTNVNRNTFIRVKYMDKDTNEPISDAIFTINNAEGMQGVYTTDANGTFVSNVDYLNGDFVIQNKTNVPGCVTPANVTVSAQDGKWTANDGSDIDRVWDREAKKWIVEVPVYTEKNTLNIASYYNGELLPGTTIIITDNGGTVLDTLDNTTGTLVVRGLLTGDYVIKQIAPDGFVTQDAQAITITDTEATYNVTFNNDKTLVTVKTIDSIGGWELEGVVVEMYDDDELVATFDDAHKSFAGIPVGTYTLKVITMPDGYQAPSADVTVTVQDLSVEQIFITNIVDKDNTPDGGPVVYEDNRTYGTLSVIKTDSVDGKALKNVEFTFAYAENIEIDGETILAGTVIEVLKTNAEGKATLSTPVAIAIYTADGITPIKYSLTETKLPVGQYVVGASSVNLTDIQFAYADAHTPLVTLPEIEVGNNRPNIVITATSDPETRLYDENGFVAGYDYLTVLQNGQEVTYTITVENDGNATGYDIDIRDVLPAELVPINGDTGRYTVENGVIYWHIPEIDAGEIVTLVLKAKVDADNAALLDNTIEWIMPDEPYGPDEGLDKEDENLEWNKLPTSQYQIIKFSSIASQDRIIMSAFDTLTLHYNFSAMEKLDDFRFTDVIPEGLTLVEGSTMLNGQPYDKVDFDEESRTLTFFAPEEWSNNMRFTFTIQVDYIQSGSEHEWETNAKVTFLENSYTMQELTLMTDTITIVADALISVEYITDLETYIGNPDAAEDIAVLQEDDYVIYTAYIYNDGVSKLKNVMLKDILPDGMTFEPIADDDLRTALHMNAQEATWFAAYINPGEVMEFSVKGILKDQKTAIIENHVTYDVMEENVVGQNGNIVKLLDFKNTARDSDSALFQVLEFHKTAEVAGKEVKDGNVAIGDTIVYTLSVNAADMVNGISITDKLPKGVTYVEGSAQMKLAGESDWSALKDAVVYNKTDRTVKISIDPEKNSIISVDKGISYFRFSVTVDRIGSNNANANNYNKATFTNAAELEYWAFPNDDESGVTLESEAVTHMTEISVSGEKSGSVDTFEGKYADRKYVTVVAEGDELVFKISVKNSGVNALTNVVVEDKVPENTTLVTKDGDTYTNKDGALTWIIPEIKANETAEVSFTVKVTPPADKAVEIVNQAKYAVPADVNNIKASEWIETNSVVYQAILIKMASSVAGGTDATDAKTVEIGSTITYTITVENVDDIYGLNLSNKIPDGMEFVEDSAKVKIGDGAAEAAKFTLDGNTIKFNQFDEVKAGKMEVSFTVKVKDTTEYDKDVVFINQADVTLKPTKDAEKDLTMKTNPISHTTKKTNATDTPKLGLETTNASLVWGLITMVALAGIAVFGYFGFIEPNKKRRK